MKQLDTLVIIFLALWFVGWVVVFILVRKYWKHHRAKVIEDDSRIDLPGMYDDIDYSERPFINFN